MKANVEYKLTLTSEQHKTIQELVDILHDYFKYKENDEVGEIIKCIADCNYDFLKAYYGLHVVIE